MLISDFTKPELDYFRENCNFTESESYVFEMRSKGWTLDGISEHLHLSVDRIKQISRKVNKKIIKVL